MKSLFVVRINMRDGSKKYVKVQEGAWWKPKLVTRPASASQLPLGVAQLVSDWFWEKHWDREAYESRIIQVVKKAAPKPKLSTTAGRDFMGDEYA